MLHLPVGTRLRSGDYTIGSVVAQGGFGIVYNGSDTNLQSRVAIKEFFPQGATRHELRVAPGLVPADVFAKMRVKFEQEAQALARFDHRGIVRVHTSFAENDTVYAVMAFLAGPTLEGLIEKRGALPENEALEFIEQIGAALEVVHNAGLIHRDINPSNVILHADGRIVLIDFGLNHELKAASLYGTRQLSGTMALGTPCYAPPEQHKTKSETGVFTDIYALGATLFFLLTGQAPQEVLERYHEDDTLLHLQNSRVSRVISEAILQAMALKSAERLQSVAEFFAALRAAPPTNVGIHARANSQSGATMVFVPSDTAQLNPKPTDIPSLQLRYWTAFHQFMQDKTLAFRIAGKPAPQNWVFLSPFGCYPFKLAAILSLRNTHASEANEIRAEVTIEGPSARQFFAMLEENKDQIEAELGLSLNWYAGETAKICRIRVFRTAIIQDERNWPQQHEWLTQHLEKMHRVFNDRVRNLTLP